MRRSGFGERLLAMKDSPAACATLGLDVTRLKLAVFALSASMAGVGGALYAGTLGSVGYERFNLFESLPLLLLAVVGGIGTAAGALFAGVILGGFPIAVGIWPFLDNLNRLLPGTMGVAMGRNPNGAVRDIAGRYGVLTQVPVALAGLVVSLVAAAALAITGAITGWALFFAGALTLVVWPQLAEIVVARRSPRQAAAALEWAGIDRPLTADELRSIDAALGLDASARRCRCERGPGGHGGECALRRPHGPAGRAPHGGGRGDHRAHRSERRGQDDAVQRGVRSAAPGGRTGPHR